MTPRGQCLWDDDTIERYSMGKLPEKDAAGLEEHLLLCERCRNRLAREDEIIGRIRGAAARHRSQPAVAEHAPSRFWHFFPALALAAILLIVGFLAVRSSRPNTAGPAFLLHLEALRGGPESRAPAGRPLALEPDLTGLPPAFSYRLELVDRAGRSVWTGAPQAASVPPLDPGSYYLRVYGDGGRLLREYGLRVEKFPPAR